MKRFGCLQLNSGNSFKENLEKINHFCHLAVQDGIQFLATPENSLCMPLDTKNVKAEEDIVELCSALAKKHNLWLSIGSVVIRTKKDEIYNRSYFISSEGQIVSFYDKIHLFDVQLPSGELYKESDFFSAGHNAVLSKTSLGNIGLTICYDLRFPYLYRSLAQQGAEVIIVSSAFTKLTGNAHWEPLLRARAIENSCYILAPNQFGLHADQKETYGHSMIISPWGDILEKLEEGERIISTYLDFSKVHSLRKILTSLQDKVYSLSINE